MSRDTNISRDVPGDNPARLSINFVHAAGALFFVLAHLAFGGCGPSASQQRELTAGRPATDQVRGSVAQPANRQSDEPRWTPKSSH
jgi:hypothetical protein